MNADRESIRARRYLLGEASDEERAAIEQEYFADAAALERVEAAEDSLIEDYLSDRLESDERARFEREYLTVPHRRRRVEMIQGLLSAGRAASAPTAKRFRTMEWVSLAAAALVIVMLGGWWLLRTRPVAVDTRDQRAAASRTSEPATVTPRAARIFAMSISPISVRSAGEGPTLVVPVGTDVVRLYLEGDGGNLRIESARARVRTVTGGEAWRGPAGLSKDAPAATVATIDVPADRLPPEDYVIELFEVDATGVERERSRYFLAVRAR